jgi:hypothetical protein
MSDEERQDIETPKWVEVGFAILAFALIVIGVTVVAFFVFMAIVRFGLWVLGV